MEIKLYHFAKVAQLVEHDLAKVRVAGSNPVFRSNFTYMFLDLRIYVYANGYK